MVRVTANKESRGGVVIEHADTDNTEQVLQFMFDQFSRDTVFILERFEDHSKLSIEVYREDRSWIAEAYSDAAGLIKYVSRPTRKAAIVDCVGGSQ